MSEDRSTAPRPEGLEHVMGASADGIDEEGSVPLLPRARSRPAPRIPDDEVARPEAAAAPVADGPAPVEAAPRATSSPTITIGRIITINPPEMPEAPEAPDAPDLSHTPAMPSAIEAPPVSGPTLHVVDEEAEADDKPWGDPVEDPDDSLDDEALTLPHLPPAPSTPSTPTLVAASEDLEVDVDDEALTPATPRVRPASIPPESDRRSDPGEASEIHPEDLVAVEPVLTRPPTGLPPAPPVISQRPPAAAGSTAPRVAPPPPPAATSLVIVPPRVGSVAPPAAADSLGPRRKTRLWWEDLFNDDYLRTMERTSDAQLRAEVDFIEESLGIERGGAVLDVACGTGRHAVELARRGYEVVGIDLSLAMLARAGEEAQEQGVKLNFVQGDIREMTFEAQFDGAYCWNTSFGYFEEEKNAQVVAGVHRALKAGGLFLLDVANRDFLARQSPSLAWFEGEGCVCMDDSSLDFITSRVKVKRTMMLEDGRTREIEYSIRVYSLHELGKLLHDQGFKVCEVSGRIQTPGVFFGNESARTMILSEKR
jgi:SAM-dependent methyltransferase